MLLVVADSLRADHLGCYGYPRATSPFLDALAAEGVLFLHAYSQSSWTSPAVATLFTSLYPSVHRLGHADTRYGYTWTLSAARPTLAEVMRAHGFRTHAIVNNPALSERRGFARGFDSYRNDERPDPDRPTPPSDPQVIALLERLRGDDFLLVWHILDPHWPYVPPPEQRVFVAEGYAGRFAAGFTREYVKPLERGELAIGPAEREQIVALYDGEIRHVDAQLRRVLEAVEALGLRSRLSVLFTSDHGEGLLDHGHFGHVLPMYEENLRVPLLVRDDRFPPRRVEEVVESLDLMPTVLDLAGVPAPEGLQGRSLLPLLRGRPEAWPAKPAFSEAPQFVERKSLRADRFQLVWGVAGQMLNDAFVPGTPGLPQFVSEPHVRLYDHAAGGVARELEGEYADAARELIAAARAAMERNEAEQVAERSLFRSFYAAEDWREQVHATGGRVVYRDGALQLGDDVDAFALWKLDFPRPVRALEVHVLASCEGEARYFSVSPDQRQSAGVSWHPGAGPRFRNARIEVPELPGTRTLYFRFHQTKPAGCALRGFYVNAAFEPEEHLDDESRRHLQALGYLE